MKFIIVLAFVCLASGCASGYLDLYGKNGKKVGECTAGFDWHPIGVKHSVNWVLNYCYELAVSQSDNVESVSNSSVIEKDYTYPDHASGKPWNKELAWSSFWSDDINEQQYGYIVADLENQYYLETTRLEEQLVAGEITQEQHNAGVAKAKYVFYGK
ncbi:MAG: hypothetical protein WA981_06610 [Glaciecola sp.]